LSIKLKAVDQQAKHLSGGNQQKVVLAMWLATPPKILIFDEPTRRIVEGSPQRSAGVGVGLAEQVRDFPPSLF
jgi:ABC-type sugar transport system ATPase subunit